MANMRRSPIVMATIAIAAVATWQTHADPVPAAPKARLTEAQAIKIATSPFTDWSAQSAQALDAMYTPDAIGFDASTAPLVANGAAFIKINQDFKAMNYDKMTIRVQKAQVLSDDIFIFTSYSDLASTKGPGKATSWRCTDLFQRQPDGKFLVVNEHCSFPPRP